jgi:hypothetical protein
VRSGWAQNVIEIGKFEGELVQMGVGRDVGAPVVSFAYLLGILRKYMISRTISGGLRLYCTDSTAGPLRNGSSAISCDDNLSTMPVCDSYSVARMDVRVTTPLFIKDDRALSQVFSGELRLRSLWG